MKRNTFYFLVLVGIAIRIAMLVRYDLFAAGGLEHQLSADGVVGLAGKHLVDSRAGSIPASSAGYPGGFDARLAALGFSLFGVGAVALRLFPFVFSLIVPVLVYRFVYVHYSVSAARWATALTAVAPVRFVQSNLKAHDGSAIDAIVLLAAMLLFWRFFILRTRRAWMGFVLGAGAALSVWLHPRMLWYVALIVTLLAVQRRDRRGWRSLVVGLGFAVMVLIGQRIVYPPAIVQSGLSAAEQLPAATRRSAIAQDPRGGGWPTHDRRHGMRAAARDVHRLGAVFGVPSSFARAGESGPLSGVRARMWILPLLVFGIALAACRPRKGRSAWGPIGSDQILGLFVLATIVVGWTGRGVTASVYPLAAMTAGVLCSRLVGARRRWMAVGVAAVLVFQAASWADAWARGPGEGARRSSLLLAKLDEKEINRCFSLNPLYDVVFTSRERVMISPLRQSRFPAYDRQVGEAGRFCYLFEDGELDDPRHASMLALLNRGHPRRRREHAGGFTILYDFEPRPVLSAAELAKVRRSDPGRARLRGKLRRMRGQ